MIGTGCDAAGPAPATTASACSAAVPALAIDGGPRGFTGEYPPPFFGGSQIGDAELAAVTEVIRAQALFRYYGPQRLGRTTRFERQFADWIGTRHALAVSSGTAALRAALAALGIGRGDEVILPAFTFIATVNAVVSLGARPVFADVDRSLCIDPDIEHRISPSTRAVIAVHIQGVAADVQRLRSIADRRGIALVEDCAQACGASLHGRRLGSFGDISAFSFQQNKLLCTGEGGAVVSDRPELHERARIFHDQGGQRRDHEYPSFDDDACFFGDNVRMTELTAAIADVQLARLPRMLAVLGQRKRALQRQLVDLGLDVRPVIDSEGDAGCSLCWYASTAGARERWLSALRAEGLAATRFYGRPVYLEGIVKRPRLHSGACGAPPPPPGGCPVAEALSHRAIWLPLPPILSDAQIDGIGAVIAKLLHHLGC